MSPVCYMRPTTFDAQGKNKPEHFLKQCGKIKLNKNENKRTRLFQTNKIYIV